MHFADLEATHPGRFLLGLGVSHTKLAEQYRRLYAAMVDPLDALDAAGAPADRRAPPPSAPACSASPSTARPTPTRTW
ncbi:hypothetical protein [Streptomyces europaeiscabiei]|uniref:hypothetical protein n=1 Tax=Streptomyces europaeiscabiei TaxID=146819 RepID=UPI002E185B60